MAQVIADRRDIDFVLYEQLEADKLGDHEKFKEFNKKTFDLMINEARNYSIKEVLPTLAEGDKEGAVFDSGTVTVPECYHKPYKMLVEGEWIAMTEDPEVGGQGFPLTVGQAALEYLIGANFAFAAYAFAGHGTGKMIEIFGTEEQKELYLGKVYSGEWGGTMVLTEPEAGSDVGNLSTTAVPNGDGTYSISGNKIFITNGEHDLTPNIIHPVLARIEGAPKGTKGISLFIVPKFWVNEDGSLGEKNDVVCTGIEHKMGLKGSATCSLTFGGQGKCRGVLLGEANKGMRVMFHMMNEARLAVGTIGACNASTSYLYALNYAKERIQGRDMEEFFNHDAPAVPIIKHPDVRRMLLWMKSHVDGMRSLIYYGANLFDRIELAQTDEEKDYLNGLVEILTPIIKAYCTDRGFEVCVQAIQCYGGYGYTKEFPVEQILRDSKINSIYEGTNGIQAMDLLGRKMGMKKGAYFMNLLAEISKTVAAAKEIQGLEENAAMLESAVARLGEVAMHLGKVAIGGEIKRAFSFATPLQDIMGDVIMGWMLLWRACIAAPKLEKLVEGKDKLEVINKNKNAAFYEGQVKTSEFFIQTILPGTLGKMNAVAATNDSVISMPEACFQG